ncbi:MAG: TonB-dependent receptor [Rhodospirillaceae bacterium]|jgi:iron complex outermembrane recepter protein|nr:TonB-dependent receptor [Rhodospirillaceae bacterium]MBT5564213.1 TonB-dependent receptor [Rhodospirillaceae bacterium]MBT6088481.1 TonB-dependent receptor [Rhodospirillaceae bacterium]
MKFRTILLAGVAMAIAMPASAQQISLEEIVVTARKRSESLMDIPLTVSAFSSADIEQAGYTTITDLVEAVPGVTYGSFEAEGRGDSASFRGVSTNTGDPTLQNSSKFIDGVYVSGSLFTALLSDLERVEVIKGPQSALYGRATFSGAINYITKKPTNEFEGSVSATVAEHDEIEISGSLSGPIVEDRLAIRVSGGLLSKGSEYTNITNGAEMGEDDIYSISSALRFTPSDEFTADLSLSYSDADLGEAPRATTALNSGELAFPLESVIGGNVDQLDNPGIQSETFRGSLQMNYDMNGYTLTSITGYGEEDTVNQSDGNYDPNKVGFLSFLCNAGPFVGSDCSIFQTVTERRLESKFQEFRITSPEGERLSWIVGASYFDEDFSTARLRNFRQSPSLKTTENLSVYGSVSYEATDQLSVSFDARYQNEDIKVENLDTSTIQEGEFNSFLPRFIVEYSPSEDTLLYASAAKGNKPGTFNSSGPPQFAVVDEETLWTYEVGTKVNALDDILSIQASGYFIDWTNQVFRFNDPDPTIGSYFVNAGETEVWGADFSVNAQFNENFSGSFSYSYVDTEFKVFESANALTILGDADVSGNQTPRTAGNSLYASLEYQAPLTMVGDGYEWFARADLSYRDELFIDELNLETIEPQTLVNLRLGIDTGPARVTLFVDNVTNSDALTTGFRFGAVALVGLPQSRQFGARASYKF